MRHRGRVQAALRVEHVLAEGLVEADGDVVPCCCEGVEAAEVVMSEMDDAAQTGEEREVVAGVRAGDASAFASLTERFRRERLRGLS